MACIRANVRSLSSLEPPYEKVPFWLEDSVCRSLGSRTSLPDVPIKNNPLGKIHYLSYCNRFSTKFTAFTEEDSCHIRSKISTQYLLWFKNYNHLNLKVQFLPRDALLSMVYAVVVCLSVCLCVCVCVCVCPSHSGIVSKRLNVGSRK